MSAVAIGEHVLAALAYVGRLREAQSAVAETGVAVFESADELDRAVALKEAWSNRRQTRHSPRNFVWQFGNRRFTVEDFQLLLAEDERASFLTAKTRAAVRAILEQTNGWADVAGVLGVRVGTARDRVARAIHEYGKRARLPNIDLTPRDGT